MYILLPSFVLESVTLNKFGVYNCQILTGRPA